MIVPTADYPVSRDYHQLWQLAHQYSIVCIVDMEHGKPETCRDIARTSHSADWQPDLVQVGSRGIGHVWAESVDEFVAGCEACNLEWLVPPHPEGEGLTDEELNNIHIDLVLPGLDSKSLVVDSAYERCLMRAAIAADRARRPTPLPPADVEVAELVADVREQADYSCCEFISSHDLHRAADLLQRQYPQSVAIPGEEYHEDMGPALWWQFPIEEPPYSGMPLDTDWPGYHTHFTPLVIPAEPPHLEATNG